MKGLQVKNNKRQTSFPRRGLSGEQLQNRNVWEILERVTWLWESVPVLTPEPQVPGTEKTPPKDQSLSGS